MPKYITKNPFQTQKIGKDLAQKIIKRKAQKRKALVLSLEGNLGGGKTTFLQGFAMGLGIKEKILSPTFVIMRQFEIPAFAKATAGRRKPKSETDSKSPLLLELQRAGENRKFKAFYHFDCYRIQKTKDILDLGFSKIVFDSQNIIAIEWADRIKKILPKNIITIKFDFIDKEKRQVVIKKLKH